MSEHEFPVGGVEGLIEDGMELPTSGKVYDFLRSIVTRLTEEWMPGNCQTLIEEREILEVCYRARELFWKQSMKIDVEAPVTICGDIHGQFEDLILMFSTYGFPHIPPQDPKAMAHNYLFLGDYVDRGPFSIEVITLLFALHLLYPDKVSLLRGNHESRPVNMQYGFYFECSRRFSPNLYESFQYAFYCMPVCAVVGKRIICMHGGISEDLKSMDQFDLFERPCDVPDVGMISDLCWADPVHDIPDGMYSESPRGAGRLFGPKAVEDFLDRHNLDLIVRAHQVVMDGFEFFANGLLVTIFSAPSYCGHFDNLGGVLRVDKDMVCSISVFAPENVYTAHLPKKKT
ncbi:hypothetical protein CAEBREN_32030 [Caenorhabditis brenneri]|uniref:Serine/threonine-protein phosphatase n=1 Tax=Caenorhabditis brenneri TaxID=135651 RepID=G0P5J6_CAEBE|nr:hypothetical protein CAEBREN_32030 [Caenorhabditis brenneri]